MMSSNFIGAVIDFSDLSNEDNTVGTDISNADFFSLDVHFVSSIR